MRFFRKNKAKTPGPKGDDSSGALLRYKGRSVDCNAEVASTEKQDDPLLPCTIDQLPGLVQELQLVVENGGDAVPSLRKLFTLSEHGDTSREETRIKMVKDSTLVVALLRFLERCREEPKAVAESAVMQQPQLYLALLVLNNISIPVENKRLIALECNGAAALCRLLCDDPSCHLVIIILVNLTCADAALRRDMVAAAPDIQLVGALAYAFGVACLTQGEYEALKHLLDDPSTRLLAMDAVKETSKNRVYSAEQMYPSTARWCLCALQNLTRPSKESTNPAAQELTRSGIVPLILAYVTVHPPTEKAVDTSFESASSTGTPVPADPLHRENSPSMWGSETAQSAALFVIMNIAAEYSSRQFLLKNTDAVHLLAAIAEHGNHANDGKGVSAKKQSSRDLEGLQCLKARMALAYLIASEGNFGQERTRKQSQPVYGPTTDDSALLVSKVEMQQLVELLAHTLHRRAKEGAGGYSAATFNLKFVLFAIRCLLTQQKNQEIVAETSMVQLNALLMKVLGLHTLQKVAFVDSEAAEYACWCLYLLSHYGFHACFLPYSLGNDSNVRSLMGKIMVTLKDMPGSTLATRHAASQLILRIKYLIFIDTDETKAGGLSGSRIASDYCFDTKMVAAVKELAVTEKLPSGAKPRADIFNRVLLRGKVTTGKMISATTVDSFPSALHAVHELSFGSTKVQHVEPVDDVMIANNICNCADHGNMSGYHGESYGYIWSWKDLGAVREETEFAWTPAGENSHFTSLSMLVSQLGLDNLCGSDTTKK